MKGYNNADMTYCAKADCGYSGLCRRHIDNYCGSKPYVSVADFEGSDYCLKKVMRGADNG